MVVSAGGIAIGTEVISAASPGSSWAGQAAQPWNSAGGELVATSGKTVATIVSSGGSEAVYSGGVALATTVFGGGVEPVSAGGTVLDTTLRANAIQNIVSGGTAISTGAFAGGTEHCRPAERPSARIYRPAGWRILSAAGISTASRSSAAAGCNSSSRPGRSTGAPSSAGEQCGVLRWHCRGRPDAVGRHGGQSGSVAAGQTVNFDGSGGDLALFNRAAFAAMIGGFGSGDTIDLGNFAFHANTRTHSPRRRTKPAARCQSSMVPRGNA